MRQSYIRSEEKELEVFEYFKDLLKYDPFSGGLFWKKDVSYAVKNGMISGSIDSSNGYRNIISKGLRIKAHRLAFFLYHGRIPKSSIDHIDGNRDNNAIWNLREVSDCENQQNRKCHRNGLPWGTAYHKASNTYASKIMIDKKLKSFGYFKTREEAHQNSLMVAKKNNIIIKKQGDGLCQLYS